MISATAGVLNRIRSISTRKASIRARARALMLRKGRDPAIPVQRSTMIIFARVASYKKRRYTFHGVVIRCAGIVESSASVRYQLSTGVLFGAETSAVGETDRS